MLKQGFFALLFYTTSLAQSKIFKLDEPPIHTSCLINLITLSTSASSMRPFASIVHDNTNSIPRDGHLLWTITTNTSRHHNNPPIHPIEACVIMIIVEGDIADSNKLFDTFTNINQTFRVGSTFSVIIVRLDTHPDRIWNFPGLAFSIPKVFLHFLSIEKVYDGSLKNLKKFPHLFRCIICRRYNYWLFTDLKIEANIHTIDLKVLRHTWDATNFIALVVNRESIIQSYDFCLQSIQIRHAHLKQVRSEHIFCTLEFMLFEVLAKAYNFTPKYLQTYQKLHNYPTGWMIEAVGFEDYAYHQLNCLSFKGIYATKLLYCDFEKRGTIFGSSDDGLRGLMWFRPFGKWIWTVICVTFFFVTFILFCALLFHDALHWRERIWEHFWAVFFFSGVSALLGQETKWINSRVHVRFNLCLILSSMMYIISLCYQHFITSHIIAPDKVKPFQNLGKLMNAGYNVAIQKRESEINETLQNPKDDLIMTLMEPYVAKFMVSEKNKTSQSSWDKMTVVRKEGANESSFVYLREMFGNPGRKLAWLDRSTDGSGNTEGENLYSLSLLRYSVKDVKCFKVREEIMKISYFTYFAGPLRNYWKMNLRIFEEFGLPNFWINKHIYDRNLNFHNNYVRVNASDSNTKWNLVKLRNILSLWWLCGCILFLAVIVLTMERGWITKAIKV
ncbi:hypothetical protein Fcan01_06587 [Folsomia candida]|uniref:Uncharacterized protein n=1 Tax=Folsomia candida TaxID=158441 RepID=A0A226EIC9_FOLCA|nr:hypothetical protein Fcan01_06587 [Folsomia candida]